MREVKESLYSEFCTWIMNTYPNIFNGDMLVEHMEDGDLQEQFLEDKGLDTDIDIWNYR